jgi:hypothetical protein
MTESTGNGPERPVWQQVIQAVARFVITVAVVFYTLLDELLFPCSARQSAGSATCNCSRRLGG